MQIDCELCPDRKGEERCADCLVEFIIGLEDEESPDAAAAPDADELRALRALRDAGLLPRRRTPRNREAG